MDTCPSDDDRAELKRIARRLDDEPEHCFQVCHTALILFDELADVHGLGEEGRVLLEAGALLHDTGHSIDFRAHHKHSRDIIMETPLPGFSNRQQRMAACIARYHRKAHPDPGHKHYCELDESDRQIVHWCASILRIADGLDRSHDCSTRSVSCEVNGSTLHILVEQRSPNEANIWGGARKRALLEETSGLTVEIAAR